MERLIPGFGILALFGLMLMLSHVVFEKSKSTEKLFHVGSKVAFFSLVGLVLSLMAAVVLS